jgi:hypothetical protein
MLRSRLVFLAILSQTLRGEGAKANSIGVLVLGLPDAADRVVLLQPDREVPLGARVY